jgi:hypothetical protein
LTVFFSVPITQHFFRQSSTGNGLKKTFLEIFLIDAGMDFSSIWPDISLFSLSGFRPDFRYLTGYENRPDYLAGYPVHPYPL